MNIKPREHQQELFPRILITDIAYGKICTLVDIATKEVGWLGQVTKLDQSKENKPDIYTISDIFLFDQEVYATETEIDEEALSVFFNDHIEIADQIKFWGHSHVEMAVNPSAQDLSQMEELMENGADYFIMGIFNKDKEVRFAIYDNYYIYDNVNWTILSPHLDSLMEEFDKKVTEGIYNVKYTKTQYYNKSPKTQNKNRPDRGGSKRKQNSNEPSEIGLRKNKNLGRGQSRRAQPPKSDLSSPTYKYDESGCIVADDERIWEGYSDQLELL